MQPATSDQRAELTNGSLVPSLRIPVRSGGARRQEPGARGPKLLPLGELLCYRHRPQVNPHGIPDLPAVPPGYGHRDR